MLKFSAVVSIVAGMLFVSGCGTVRGSIRAAREISNGLFQDAEAVVDGVVDRDRTEQEAFHNVGGRH